ncbi:organic cation transporter protein-like [Actinia tenebrosa]|uniref:Organic cation transporter protein-like n=1 Tax=Actinia tenebrosa TaxID=6105 RepID=A0A6P8HXG5_ACTTE|nr:organic cation transporter protein-like [Actinia tenebrosa]
MAKQSDLHEFDNVFRHVKSFGRYQVIGYLSINLLIFSLSSQWGGIVFALSSPGFHCANTTGNTTCEPNVCCDECTSYVFDGTFTSSVTKWNLICDRAYLGATIQSCFFVGMLIGSFVTGMVSDAWGRKECIFFCNALFIVSNTASAFVDCISFFAFLRFTVGFSMTGVMLTSYIYGVELAGPKKRTAAGIITYFYWSGSSVVFTLIAYLIRDWRYLLTATCLPNILLFPFWRLMPESPRWLIANNKLDEAENVLMKFGGKRGRPIDSDQLRKLIENIRIDQEEKENHAERHTPLDLLRTPKMRKWTLIMGFQWFSTALESFGILIFFTQLAGDPYLNYLILAIATVVRVPFTWVVFLKFGRRISYGGSVIFVGVVMLATYAVKDIPKATTAFAIIGFVLLDHIWSGVYLITSEIFPTVLRNTGQGTGSTIARIGAIIAPYVAMLSQIPSLGVIVPIVIFGALALIAGVMMNWIPETLYAPMHQTIEEAEAAKEDFGIPCCGNILDEDERMDEDKQLTRICLE